MFDFNCEIGHKIEFLIPQMPYTILHFICIIHTRTPGKGELPCGKTKQEVLKDDPVIS